MDDNKVAVILEDLRSQFKVFGGGLQMVNDKIDRVKQKLDAHIEKTGANSNKTAKNISSSCR